MQRRLARRFRLQEQFAADYSPLYSRLFGIIANWLTVESDEARQTDWLTDWLVRTGAHRAAFDVPLLLLAGLHRDVLRNCPGVQALARYFPSTGGTKLLHEGNIADDLRLAIDNQQVALESFVRTATVQTNETARGLCWLLPVLYPGWKSIHLIELGASAGLNLVAEQRHYQLTAAGNGQLLMELGSGPPGQCTVASEGAISLPRETSSPIIQSRHGCDLAPLTLQSVRDKQILEAFVWADQIKRLDLLRQGIAAVQRINSTDAPVHIVPANLPDHLPRFLQKVVSPLVNAPVVLYNTYLTTYLHDKGASLRPLLAAWATRQPQPVLWMQWETLWQGPQPPDFGWMGWTADLWQDGRHQQWHLAWTHPHGTRIQWLPESASWTDFWNNSRC